MNTNVLVIEDDQTVRKAFAMAFEGTDYKVTIVESGQKGIEATSNTDYGLIFLDLKMPGMNGVQTLRQLRENNIQVPIYIVTGFYIEYLDDLQSAENDGIDFDLLQKPVTEEQILMVTRNVLKKE